MTMQSPPTVSPGAPERTPAGSTLGVGILRAARALTYLVYAFVVVALVILAFGFFLLLFGANPEAAFAEWVYRSMDRVMAPFRGLFESVPLNGDSVLDTSVLFAMIVYAIAGMALHALIDWLTMRLLRMRSRVAPATDGTYR
jgi:uncharacterized protein YggT (Ycf19 family)